MVETEGLHAGGFFSGEFQKQLELQSLLHRIGQPVSIAHSVVFLASDDSSWITGESLYVRGGSAKTPMHSWGGFRL
jgi:3-oxoacyl-[acyl-carrier protein] reductase